MDMKLLLAIALVAALAYSAAAYDDDDDEDEDLGARECVVQLEKEFKGYKMPKSVQEYAEKVSKAGRTWPYKGDNGANMIKSECQKYVKEFDKTLRKKWTKSRCYHFNTSLAPRDLPGNAFNTALLKNPFVNQLAVGYRGCQEYHVPPPDDEDDD